MWRSSHSIATLSLESGYNIRTAQEFLGYGILKGVL